MKTVRIKPPVTLPEERVEQLKKEMHKYKSLCEHLGAVVFYENLSFEEITKAWIAGEHRWFPPDAKDRNYFYNGGTWEEFSLVELRDEQNSC